MNYVVYLIDESDGSSYTMLNSTIGMHRAWEELCSKVKNTRALRKARVMPVVIVGSTLMKTNWGMKARPDFRIVGWKGLTNEQPLLTTVASPSAGEIMNDSLPDNM